MTKFLTYLIAVPVVLIIVAVLLVTLLLDKDKVLKLASEALHDQTGATLTVEGDSELSFYPTLGVALQKARLELPEEQQAEISVEALTIGVQLLPLLSKRIEIDAVAIDGLVARMVSSAEQPKIDSSKLTDAQLDAVYAQRRKMMASAAEESAGASLLAAPLALKVRDLRITDSRVELVDPDSGEVTVVKLLSLQASDLNLDDRPMPIELRFELPGEQTTSGSLEMQVRANQTTQIATLSPLQLELRGVTARPVSIEARGEVHMAKQLADLELTLELGEGKGVGQLRYASFESPQIDAILKFDLLDTALLLLAGPEAATKNADASTGDEPLPLDAIRSIDTRADLSIERARWEGHEVEQLRVKLRALDGLVKISSLTGKLHGGEIDLQAIFNGRHNVAKLETVGGVKALDIALALEAAGAQPMATGNASLTWQLTGSGRSFNALIEGLSGPIQLQTADVQLPEMNVEHMLCKAVAQVNREKLTSEFPPNSSFQALAATIQLAGGNARLNPLRAEFTNIKLAGQGNLGLLTQEFKATLGATLAAELAKTDPACRINERISGIVWPIACSGSVAGDPADWCGIDTGEIIASLAKNEVKREAGKLFRKFLEKNTKSDSPE